MKITFLTPRPDLSGGQRVITIYARHLAERGHTVRVVCARPRRRPLKTKVMSLVSGNGWPAPKKIGASHFERMGVDFKVVDHDGPLVEADLPDADVCVSTWWSTSHWLMKMPAAKGAKAYFMQDYGAPGQEWEKVEPTWSFPMKIITISRWLFDRVREVNPAADLVLAPNGVELEKFTMRSRSKNNPLVVGMIYRRLQTKRSGLGLEAFAQHHAAGGRGRLIVVGGEPLPEHYLDAPWLDAVGAIEDAALIETYQNCDAWLFTSASEGFGLPILEAMSCGTPVIAAPSGAAPELVPSGGGWLVEDFTAPNVAAAIGGLDELTPEAWAQRSAAARALAERYDWTRATQLFEAALLDAAGRGPDTAAEQPAPAEGGDGVKCDPLSMAGGASAPDNR